MKAIVIPPGGDIIREVTPLLVHVGRDYSASMVLFQGRRPGHYLRRTVAEGEVGSFLPPAVFSMDEFVDALSTRNAGRRLEAVDAVALLYGIHVAAGGRLGGDSYLSAETFFPIGLKLWRDLEELLIEDVPPERVKEIGPFMAEDIPERASERLQSLAHFYREFYRTCREQGYTTRSMRYAAGAEKIRQGGVAGYSAVIVAGFHGLTASERTIFRELAAQPQACFVFHDSPETDRLLRDAGIGAERRGIPYPRPAVHFYGSPDSHGQVYALNRVLDEKGKNGTRPDHTHVVVLPNSETLFPLIRQGLSGLGANSCNISTGYPLHRTPVFGFLDNLMDAVGSMDGDAVYIPDYLRFMLHPYTKNTYLRGIAEVTRILVHAIEACLIGMAPRSFIPLQEIEGNDNIFNRTLKGLPSMHGFTAADLSAHLSSIHRTTLLRFRSFSSVGDLAGKAADLIAFVGTSSTAPLHPLFQPYAEAFLQILDVLSGSLMKDVAFAETPAYFSFLRRYIMTGTVPFEGTPVRGLQVLGFLETRTVRFDTVYILDCNEDVLPDTKKEDTLLPLGARRRLGLLTYRERDALVAHTFHMLVCGAREVHIFSLEKETKERSRFAEQLLWELQREDRVTDSARYVRQVQYAVNLKEHLLPGVPKGADVLACLKTFRFSASSLVDYLRCGLRFYYSWVLKLREREDLDGALSGRDIGALVHEILEDFFRRTRGRPLTKADLDSGLMDAVVRKVFASVFREERTGASYLLYRQVSRRMQDLLRHYYQPLVRDAKVTVRACERTVEAAWNAFTLKGRIDRIEERDGKLTIIDYKTSASRKSYAINFEKLDPDDRLTWSGAIGSLQLPLYLILAGISLETEPAAMNALFLMLGAPHLGPEAELPFLTGRNDTERLRLTDHIILSLLKEITDPSVPFLPAAERSVCAYCTVSALCGR